MKQTALVMLTAAALALSGCGEQTPAQKARRAAVEAETAARKALIKAAPEQWEAYRNNGVAARKRIQTLEFPDGGYDVEHLGAYGERTRNALIEAAPAEWNAYMTAHNAASAVRLAAWTELAEAESSLQKAARTEWEVWKMSIDSDKKRKAGDSKAAEAANALKRAKTTLKRAAPKQWKTYKAAVSEVMELGQR